MSSAQDSPKNNSFFTLAKPYLAFVDSPRLFTKPYGWLFNLIAIIYLLIPFALLYVLIDNRFFKYSSGKVIFAAILSLIAILAASFIAFQIWLNRKKEIVTEKLTTDIIVDALGHLVHTAFEASATWVGIAGTLAGLFTVIFGGGILESFGVDESLGVAVIIGSLVGGYFGVILAKLAGFLFKKIAGIIIYAVVRIFYFIVHIIKQLFEYFFIFWQSLVDFLVNGWRVVIALVAKLGNTLLAFAGRKGPSSPNNASVTYNS